MGKGNLVFSNDTKGSWEPIVPGSHGEFIHKYVCSQNSKKKF
jgi:hypothetical protein